MEGVIKYRCRRIESPPLHKDLINPLLNGRDRCYLAGLIGVDESGVGYGNISMRTSEGFVITGTQTGGSFFLPPDGYTEVIEVDIEQNKLICRGPIDASSEALTHAMIYTLDPAIHSVLHVHHRPLWERLLNIIPTTDPEVDYGSPEMAREIERLWTNTDLPQLRVLAMAGHEEGLIFFGESVAETAEHAIREAGLMVTM